MNIIDCIKKCEYNEHLFFSYNFVVIVVPRLPLAWNWGWSVVRLGLEEDS